MFWFDFVTHPFENGALQLSGDKGMPSIAPLTVVEHCPSGKRDAASP